MRSHDESDIQRNCIKWIRAQYPNVVCFSIPNGGRRDKIGAAILKSEGLLAGAADLFLAHPKVEYSSYNFQEYDDDSANYTHGIFLEIKTPTGRQSESQKEFEKKVLANGYDYRIVRSLDQFMKIVKDYLK